MKVLVFVLVAFLVSLAAGGPLKASRVQSFQVEELARERACRDGKMCGSTSTCCNGVNDEAGCCMYPNAVCCSDGRHCCPAGFVCDITSNACRKDGNVMKLMADLTGYTCDVSAGTCTNGANILDWTLKSNMPTRAGKLQNLVTTGSGIMCPDSKTSCPASNTCCPLDASGQWGCCPVQNAVCCDDHIHCCPSGYSCGTSSCQKGSRHLPLLTKSTGLLKLHFEGQGEPEVKVHDDKHLLFTPDEPETGSVICPGGKSECPSGNTCCLTADGDYACCPFPQAVCCSDQEHCCPSGYTCDLAKAQCTKRLHRLPWVSKVPSTPLGGKAVTHHGEVGDNIMCPDEISSCPTGSTCCQTPGGIYGCCPYVAAICCADLIHCCPSGYACQTATGTCTKDDHIMPWAGKIPVV